MKLIDGKKIAEKKLTELKEKINNLNKELSLAVILVGNDPASQLYVKLKEKKAKKIGIELRKYIFDENTKESEIITCLNFLNQDNETNAIIIQLPLPKGFNQNKIVNLINFKKDVDGFHQKNQKMFLNDEKTIKPVFPSAILSLIKSLNLNLKLKKAIVIGKSDVFDRVMCKALEKEGCYAKFVKFNKTNENLTEIKKADIIVTACGIPNLLKGNLFKNNAIVIDGGISKFNGKVVGDIDKESCENKNIWVSPVPGGVGPVTIVCLLENVYELWKNKA